MDKEYDPNSIVENYKNLEQSNDKDYYLDLQSVQSVNPVNNYFEEPKEKRVKKKRRKR